MAILTHTSAKRRAQALQVVAPSMGWAPPKTERIDPDLPQFLPVPVAFGSRPVSPAPIARPKSKAGQFTIVKTFGKGPLQVSNLRLGTDSLFLGRLETGKRITRDFGGTFGVVTYELLEGRVGDGGLNLFPGPTATANFNSRLPIGIGSEDSDFAIHRTEPSTTAVDLVLSFPNGLAKKVQVNGQWTYKPLTVTIEVRWRLAGADGLPNNLAVSDPRVVVTGKDNKSAFSHTIPVVLLGDTAAKRDVAIRIRKVSDPAQSPEVRWISMTSRGPKSLGGATGHAVIAVQGVLDSLGGDQFLRELNADCIPELAETVGGTPVATRNPAAAFLDVLQGRGALHPLADARIDSAAIAAWKADCATAGYTFDYVFGADGGRGSVADALRLICAAGRARHVVRDGLHSVIREPSGDPIELFTPANMKPGFRRVRNAYGETLHGIRCTIENREQGFRRETFVVYASGFTAANATEFEDWTFDGTTSRGVAANLAAYHLQVLGSRGQQYEFGVGKDHLRALRGDLVRVAHYRIRKGTSWGRVTAIPSATALDVSRPCAMATGGTYAIRVRQADGDLVLSTVTTTPGDHVRLTTTTAHGAAVGDLFAFGDSGADSELCVVLKVSHSDDMTAALVVTPFASAETATGNATGGPTDPETSLSLPVCGYVSTPGVIALHEIG